MRTKPKPQPKLKAKPVQHRPQTNDRWMVWYEGKLTQYHGVWTAVRDPEHEGKYILQDPVNRRDLPHTACLTNVSPTTITRMDASGIFRGSLD
jgi:hypothetical protein